MRQLRWHAIVTLAAFLALAISLPLAAQVSGLFYQEMEKDGRIYVFNSPEALARWRAGGELGKSITLIGRGPKGETVVAENETAADLFFFKHDLPGYERPTVVAPPSPFPKTTVGGRFFGDVTSKRNKDQGTGIESNDSGVGIDVKRFYFTLAHELNATWSAQFQSDIGDVGQRRYDVFVKKAYVQYRASPAAIFRLGAADTPWVPLAEKMQAQRYFDQVIIDSLGFGTSSEWGLHVFGKALGERLDYAVTLGNGKGYSSPSRSKSIDLEARLAYDPLPGLTLAVGGYSGRRGLDTDAAPAKHTATRQNALAAFSRGPLKIGAEYFRATNWSNVTTVASDRADGLSSWIQVTATPRLTFFGRFERAEPSKDLAPERRLEYYNAGVQWKLSKSITAALGYKHAEARGGVISTGMGAIGSTRAGARGRYDEIGIWASYDF